MSGNTTAVRRTKDSSSLATNGTRLSDPAGKKNSNTSQSHSDNKNNGNDSVLDSESLTLWHHPIKTLNYFLQELLINIASLTRNTLKYKKTVWSSIIVAALFIISSRIGGPQQEVKFS